ncbi:MAG: hypothetical protein U5L96_18310 [Owenweeksia sp.]|nr:hypothetical protein [Owenweeksia sp.]
MSLGIMKTDSKLTFGAEMWEADNQDELNLYLQDSIDQKALDTLARLWPELRYRLQTFGGSCQG